MTYLQLYQQFSTMEHMRAFRAEGIVIRRQTTGEADRILTLFTKDQGKIRIIAKGIRRITSKRASHLEMCTHASFALVKGHILPVLTEVQSLTTFPSFRQNLRKAALAYHICEVIESLCPENQENRRVFQLFHKMLATLEYSDNYFTAIRMFHLNVLEELGYIAGLDKTTIHKPTLIIENILERKLKTREILPQLL